MLAMEKAVDGGVIATFDEIEREIARTLQGKFGWRSDVAAEALDLIREHSLRVRLYGTVSVCRDPGDNMVLECAERARADLIVTGDKDLLVLRSYKSTSIVTPAEYLKI